MKEVSLQQHGNRNIFLTGFMGSGKTTVGKTLAKKLNRKFIDLDSEIEIFMEKKISSVISQFGLEYFRKIENQQLAMLCKEHDAIISLGGGSLIEKNNQKQIRKSGVLIFLMAEEKTLMRRLEKSHARPLLKDKGYYELFEERRAGYMNADLNVCTDTLTPEEIAEVISKEIM